MWSENLKKLATGNVLFNLNKIISPRLVTIIYLLGLAAILLWAVNHFFSTFRFGFGSGLWGLLEIAVFGLLAIIVLRVACEAVIVYFRAHATETEDYAPVRVNASLIDDVREAIEDLAEEDVADTPPPPPAPVVPKPAAQTPPTPVAEEPAITPGADTPKPAPKRRGRPPKPKVEPGF